MSSNQLSGLKPLAPGVICALLAVLFGFVLGGAFGAAEESIKAHLNRSGEEVLDTVYQGDEKKKNAVVSKSWRYLKRAHIHGSAIGTAALGAIVVLSLLGSAGIIEKSSAMALGAGALLYSLFWFFAGMKAPALGSTLAAKESLKFMAIPGAGLCILGLCGTLVSIIKQLYTKSPNA